jgi:hypothetical protein
MLPIREGTAEEEITRPESPVPLPRNEVPSLWNRDEARLDGVETDKNQTRSNN